MVRVLPRLLLALALGGCGAGFVETDSPAPMAPFARPGPRPGAIAAIGPTPAGPPTQPRPFGPAAVTPTTPSEPGPRVSVIPPGGIVTPPLPPPVAEDIYGHRQRDGYWRPSTGRTGRAYPPYRP